MCPNAAIAAELSIRTTNLSTKFGSENFRKRCTVASLVISCAIKISILSTVITTLLVS